MTPEEAPARVRPRVEPLDGEHGFAVSVDLEEWFHTCWEPDYVDARRRPRLVEELDREIPRLLDLFAGAAVRATFFVLGEVAARHPTRVRDIADAGHEVASHSWSHRRANQLTPAEFRQEAAGTKGLLEDLTGTAVQGFRAPEWSLRRLEHLGLRLLAELGYRYDSSLTRALGAGSADNPRRLCRLVWEDGVQLLELPPLLLWRRVPASGWPGRCAKPERVSEAARREQSAGGMPVIVVHPWELTERTQPGMLNAGARAIQDLGRVGYRERFDRLLRLESWQPLSKALRLPSR